MSNYPANTVDHEIGAIVIHDYDAKRLDMRMLVVGKFGGIYVTIYLKDVQKLPTNLDRRSTFAPKVRLWYNEIDALHLPSAIPNFGKAGQ